MRTAVLLAAVLALAACLGAAADKHCARGGARAGPRPD